MKKFILFVCLVVACLAVKAAVSYKVSYLLTQGPFYSNNIVSNVIAASGLGGVMATNSVPANTTNTAMWSTLLTVPDHKEFSLMLTANSYTNTYSTNYFSLCPADDGVNVDTNHPVWTSGPITCLPNGQMQTNLTSTVIGNHGFFQLICGNQGTNTSTNVNAQAFVKDNNVWVKTP